MSHLIFIDTETGGLDPKRHALLSVALAEWRDGAVHDATEFLIRSDGLEIDPRALEVNRIDVAAHDAKALTAKQARDAIGVWIVTHRPSGRRGRPMAPTVAGHNVAFDMGFLEELFDGHWSHQFFGVPVDTLALYGFLQEAGRAPVGSRSLSAACEAFGVKTLEDTRHTALGDVLATVELYRAMLGSVAS